jgi:hypothetical protein
MRNPTPTHASAGETGSVEYLLGAAVVWLLFLGVGLNIWPGWARIAEWLR